MKPSELIERGWCQRVMARNQFGEEVFYNNSDACEWCLSGACAKVGLWWGKLIQEVRKVAGLGDVFVTGETVPGWNDVPGRTKEEVLAVLRQAETNLEADGFTFGDQ